jgi:hypothetical protein
MTDLHKPVKRRTVDICVSARRRLVVYLLPGDVIGFREEGRRRIWTAPVGKLYGVTLRWTVDAEAAAKRAERKASRGGGR